MYESIYNIKNKYSLSKWSTMKTCNTISNTQYFLCVMKSKSFIPCNHLIKQEHYYQPCFIDEEINLNKLNDFFKTTLLINCKTRLTPHTLLLTKSSLLRYVYHFWTLPADTETFFFIRKHILGKKPMYQETNMYLKTCIQNNITVNILVHEKNLFNNLRNLIFIKGNALCIACNG